MSEASASDASTLAEAEAAFVRGDFREVRRLTAVLSGALDHDVRKQAAALRSKVSVDPIAVAVWVVSACFLVAVAVRYLGGS